MVNLAAFYNVTSPGYEPVPVHTVPVLLDHLLKPAKKCKRYLQIQSELVSTPKMKRLNDQYRHDLKRMAELINSPIEYTIETMSHVMDSIECHVSNNKTGKTKMWCITGYHLAVPGNNFFSSRYDFPRIFW